MSFCFFYLGAFLVPYLICVIIGGMPLLFLEIIIGQFMQQGGINVWNIMPILRGKLGGIWVQDLKDW